MIKVYYSPSCSSCRKVRKWFDDQHIPYEGKDIFSNKLTKNDLLEIISKCENGTDDVISPRSKIVLEQHINFDDMKVSELIDFVLDNPSILRRPIIVDDRRVQVGYSPEEIEVFIPRARKLAEEACSAINCPNYETCSCNALSTLEKLNKAKHELVQTK